MHYFEDLTVGYRSHIGSYVMQLDEMIALATRKSATMLGFGFASGLPYALLLGTLNAAIGDLDRRRVEPLQVQTRIVAQGVEHRLQAVGPFGMVVARPVVEHISVRIERNRHPRDPSL